MIIEIELDLLKKLNITTSQLILIELISSKHKSVKAIKDFIIISQIIDNDILELINKNILTKKSTLEDIKSMDVTSEFLALLVPKKEYFDEFLNLFPTEVIRSDGVRAFLHTNRNKARAHYKLLVGKSEDKHNYLIECLKKDLHRKRMDGSIKYIKNIYNWLKSEDYLAVEDYIPSVQPKHGQSVV